MAGEPLYINNNNNNFHYLKMGKNAEKTYQKCSSR